MKTKFSSLYLLSCVLCLLTLRPSSSALCQIPQGFNYQAIARDGVTGNPITDKIDVKIAILEDDDPETVIWEELHEDVDPDDHGLFSIVVGQGVCQTAPTYFTDIDWTVNPLFIRTMIYYGDEWKNMGSALLQSVPYALLAKDTDTKQTLSLDGSELTISDGNTITIPSTGSVWQTDGTNIYRETGNVGIGTTSPAVALDVNGSIISRSLMAPLSIELNNYNTGDRSSYIDFHSDDKWTDYALRIRRYNGENAASRIEHRGTGALQLYTAEAAPIDFYTSGSSNHRLRIAANGNVGIGTTSPIGKLEIQPSLDWADEVPLFEVKNKWGFPVLAVYNRGVKILIDHGTSGKSVKGGFAIGGYDFDKAGKTIDFMTISPDSIRFNINNDNVKGPKGGFAIGGYDITGKGPINEDFMYITPQNSDDGQYNTFMGYQSGHNNLSTGIKNTFLGYTAGYGNTSGDNNVFIGASSGLNELGSDNIYLGTNAGSKIPQPPNYLPLNAANENVIIGVNAGLYNEGNYNVIIGKEAGEKNTAVGQVFVGWGTGGKTTSGGQNVYVGGDAGHSNITGTDNTGIGCVSLWNTTGIRNTAIGSHAGESITSGENNIAIGYNAQVATPTSSNQVRIGNSSIASAEIQVSWTITSDLKWKESIEDLVLGLNVVNGLRPVDYIRKNNPYRTREAGFIAQDVEKLYNELGIKNDGLISKCYDGSLALRYNDFIPILTKAIQEQQIQIESQNQENQQLKSELQSIKDELAQIKSMMGME
jgi:hypothetical protein